MIIDLSPERWAEYKELRLKALRECPQAFARNYDEDAALSDDDWIRTLKNAHDGKSVMLFAQSDGTLVGMIGAFFKQGKRVEHCAVIVSFYVLNEWRGRGIGSALLKECIARLIKQKTILQVSLTVNTEQHAAIELYKKQGFELVGTIKKSLKIGDCFYDEYLMVKLLP